MKDLIYTEWIRSHKADLEWVIEMAKKGIEVTEGGMDHPSNVFFYSFESDVKAADK